jgi:hypothetical protein
MLGSDRVGASREALEDLCQRHRIRRLSLFGSALREDFSETSDVDVPRRETCMSQHDDVVDYDMLWDTVQDDFPPLVSAREQMLADLG